MLRKPKKVSQKSLTKWGVGGLLLGCVLVAFIYSKPLLKAGEELVAQWLDARVQSVLIEGVKYTPKEELAAAIGLQKGDSLVRFDAAKARKNLEVLPWVKKAAVSRRLPSTLKVEVFEYAPFAQLKTNDGVWVVDKTGHKIIETTEKFSGLPMLTGEEAEAHAAKLFTFLMAYPNFVGQLQQADFIGKRRWDLNFKSGLLVKLPEEGAEKALAILQQLEQRRHVLSLSSGRVDLRLHDKVILELGEEDENSGFFF